MSLTFFDWFAGIGGFRLGLERAGMTCVGACEIDDFARRVYAKNFGHPPLFADIRDVDPRDIPHADLWCGGFPCQDISPAGTRSGLAGSRSGLWWTWWELIRSVRPGIVLLENSADLAIRGLDQILGCLTSVGYDASWQTLRASDFGAPHHRARMWVVAYSNPPRQKAARGAPRETWRDMSLHETWRNAPPGGFRVADGPAPRLDRSRIGSIGNAVVPQVVEWIGRRIVAAFDPEVTP